LIKFTTDASKGLFRLAGPKAQRDMTHMTAMALKRAAEEFCLGTLQPVNIKDRFKAAGFAKFGYSRRTGKYRKAQLRSFGAVLPFVSPRTANYEYLALALVRPSLGAFIAAARDAANKNKPRMSRIITKPGIGHRVTVTGKNRLVLRIRYPGARPLNAKPKYREEFVDLRRGGQSRAIHARAGLLFRDALQKYVKVA
jgi:hypothetical protein